ncbi:MAG: aldolase [Hyphomicrobiales bacterium]|nr:aldolase [Hyphomicrobiales bacterium]
MTEPAPPSVHAVAVIAREVGVLIRGRSGAGKSRLAEEIVAAAAARGWFGRLVADDRVRLAVRGDRVILSPHPRIAGLVERRGQGVFPVAHEGTAVLRLVIDLVDRDGDLADAPRYPTKDESRARIEGVPVPRLAIFIGDEGAASTAIRRIADFGA